MIDRRNFLKTLGTTALLSSISSFIPTELLASNTSKIKKIKPKRLAKGNKIGIIVPASHISEQELNDTLENLKKLELEGIPSKNILKKKGYLAGTDDERVEDIHDMFSNKQIDGILCARGGYGTPRILNKLNYGLIKKNPKVIMGYSDITALLNAIYLKTGLVTFHGPVGISTFNDFSIRYVMDTLFNPKNELELISEKEESKEDDRDSIKDIWVIKEGISEGILVGGNLSLIAALCGTEYEVDLANKILFLEEVGEEPYRIDRMLNQLILTKSFKKCKGIAIGIFKNCEEKIKDAAYENSLTLKEVLEDKFDKLKIPIIYGLSIGHIKNKFVVPLGVKAQLNTEKKILILKESSVI